MTLDRGSPVPLYFQVARQLEDAIRAGELPPGTRLENELELAARYRLSRPTIRQAIQHLVDQGLLVRKRGVGTQVVQSQVRRPIELSSLYDDLAEAGREPRTRVLELGAVPAEGEAAERLGVRAGAEVVRLRRLRLTGGEPLALMTNVLPAGLLEVTAAHLEEHGLYETLRAAGVNIRIAHQEIGARAATAAEARLLDERRGTPLLTMTRTAFDDQGAAVEFGTHAYRADRYSFSHTLVGK
ncbi:GntR family transcriptional regulator [Actinomadura rubrisoli]|uniref:GntR family transcriptional regulator n=1 Tax=Actinomadura rubrisoli TaxID=2530368 RepID=A0A4R5AUT2_9ACTN|nr:GntR family transcriptional regulator [Actinomadura rubrisoli]